MLRDGVRTGPHSVDELMKMGVTQETLVWTEGLDEWAPAGRVEELRTTPGGLPPEIRRARPTSSRTSHIAKPPPSPAPSARPSERTRTPTRRRSRLGPVVGCLLLIGAVGLALRAVLRDEIEAILQHESSGNRSVVSGAVDDYYADRGFTPEQRRADERLTSRRGSVIGMTRELKEATASAEAVRGRFSELSNGKQAEARMGFRELHERMAANYERGLADDTADLVGQLPQAPRTQRLRDTIETERGEFLSAIRALWTASIEILEISIPPVLAPGITDRESLHLLRDLADGMQMSKRSLDSISEAVAQENRKPERLRNRPAERRARAELADRATDLRKRWSNLVTRLDAWEALAAEPGGSLSEEVETLRGDMAELRANFEAAAGVLRDQSEGGALEVDVLSAPSEAAK